MSLDDVPPWLLASALGAAVAVLAVVLAVGAFRRWSRRRRILARVARAGEGERRAAEWLDALGYELLGAQEWASYGVEVDGETVIARVRADYVVAREGRRFVVEVKTGALAPRIETTATRRQLLEYRVAFDVDGILLVDAEAGRIRAVTFPGLRN